MSSEWLLLAAPMWTEIPVTTWLLLCTLLVCMGGVAFVVQRSMSEQRLEEVRRGVLDRLELAVARNLPLADGLRALVDDRHAREERKLSGPWKVLIEFALPFPELIVRYFTRRRLAAERDMINDVHAGLTEGSLEQALRSAEAAFPTPYPQLLGAAQEQGTLAQTLGELRQLDSLRQHVRSLARGGLLYPAAVLALVQGVGLLQTVGWGQRGIFNNSPELSSYLSTLAIVGSLLTPLILMFLWLLAGGAASWAKVLPWFRGGEACRQRSVIAGQLAAGLRAGLEVDDALRLAQTSTRADLGPALARAQEGAPVHEALGACPQLFGEDTLARLAGTPGDAAAACAALRDRERKAHRQRLDVAARATLPLGLFTIGGLVLSYSVYPFLLYQNYVGSLLW